jgi:hypothetical protein
MRIAFCVEAAALKSIINLLMGTREEGHPYGKCSRPVFSLLRLYRHFKKRDRNLSGARVSFVRQAKVCGSWAEHYPNIKSKQV